MGVAEWPSHHATHVATEDDTDCIFVSVLEISFFKF